jgi:hypothetical protein
LKLNTPERWSTRADNHADKVEHGTHNRGERHPLSKLSNSEALEIRTSPLKCREIAFKYGITRQHAWAIKAGKSRKTA